MPEETLATMTKTRASSRSGVFFFAIDSADGAARDLCRRFVFAEDDVRPKRRPPLPFRRRLLFDRGAARGHAGRVKACTIEDRFA
jgi:hypothetical protein